MRQEKSKGAAVVVFLATVALVGYAAEAAGIHYIPMFDFDGNLLMTDATHKAEHLNNRTGRWEPYNASVPEWYDILRRKDPTYRPSTTMDLYYDFSDEPGDDTFVRQVARAYPLPSARGAALPMWKEHVVHGVPFVIITARNHDAVNIRDALAKMIDLALTPTERAAMLKNFVALTAPLYDFKVAPGWWADFFASPSNVFNQYLRGCKFFGIRNNWVLPRLPCTPTSACKALLVARLVDDALVFGPKALTVMSFSDDEEPNIVAVRDHMTRYLVPAHPSICFRVYDTSDMRAPAVQYDLSPACDGIPPGDDWQSQAFLKSTRGKVIRSYRV